MKAALALAIILLPARAHAQLRLSFVGYSPTSTPRSIGLFDETVHDSLVIDATGLYDAGPNPTWYLAWSSTGHSINGYPSLLDTEAWTACGGGLFPDKYDLILWFEPGEFMIGQHVSFKSPPRSTYVYGDAWQGHVPQDFTHLRVIMVGQTYESFEGPYCFRTYLIPIHWQEQPVPTESSTFGKIKALYRTK